MGDGFLSLCWNNHRSTFCHVISTLRQKERYSDVTIACEGRFYPVHKLVLSVCSEYFDNMLEHTSCKHPIIVLKDVLPEDLEALLSYMYEGIVSVSQNDLSRLIKTAEMLRIKGLAVSDCDENVLTADGRRVTSVTTTAIPIVGSAVRQARDERVSPTTKKRRREENGVNNIQVAQNFSQSGVNEVIATTNAEPFEGRQRQRVEIHRSIKDELDNEVVVSEGIIDDERTIEDESKGTTALISTYGVVVSDGGTHTLVSPHQQDHQVITHRYEAATLAAGHATQPLAEAVAEALAGPSGMQTWLGTSDLGPTSFTTVEAYTTEADVQGAPTIQNLENVQTSSVSVANARGVAVNSVSGGTAVVVETAAPPSTPPTTTREGNQLKCQYCNRATFRQTSDLKRHIRIHTGEKPFKCNFCPYKASRKDLLQAHSSKMHSTSQ